MFGLARTYLRGKSEEVMFGLARTYLRGKGEAVMFGWAGPVSEAKRRGEVGLGWTYLRGKSEAVMFVAGRGPISEAKAKR